MQNYNRVFLIVCDSLGFGESVDAELYNDVGADTIGHTAYANNGLSIPNLEKLGIANLRPIEGVKNTTPTGVVGILQETSNGKDTLTGHWEMMGIITEQPFITFENAFPDELIQEIEEKTGRKVIGNKVASGTVILDELAEQEIEDKNKMIVYTSADSVLQVCGNENIGEGLEELYRCCEIIREITLSKPEWKIARVIARPYIGDKPGEFTRTSNRKDYSVSPTNKTVLDEIKENGKNVISIGKINDIFAGCGITKVIHSDNSQHGMKQLIDMIDTADWSGLCFCNLSDFDVKWGHRRNPTGYAQEIEDFDKLLGIALSKLNKDDLIIITADHGNDPTYKGSDHTRENVPFIAWSPSFSKGYNIGNILGFQNIGTTIANCLGIKLSTNYNGINLLSQLDM